MTDAITPAVTAEAVDDAYLVQVGVPGLAEPSIDLSGQMLRITATAVRREGHHGRFTYHVSLSADADPAQASAGLTNGVLTVRVPKKTTGRSGEPE